MGDGPGFTCDLASRKLCSIRQMSGLFYEAGYSSGNFSH